MAIEIVDFPMKNGGSFHSYVAVYQRVTAGFNPSEKYESFGMILPNCFWKVIIQSMVPVTTNQKLEGWVIISFRTNRERLGVFRFGSHFSAFIASTHRHPSGVS